jgi:hypothetical protein
MHGAIPPLPNTPSWRGDQFKKTQGQLCLDNLFQLFKKKSLSLETVDLVDVITYARVYPKVSALSHNEIATINTR